MTEPRLRILLLEDDPTSAELVQHELDRAGIGCVTRRVDTKEGFVRELHEFAPDVVLSDHSLVQFNARAALTAISAARPTTPLIIVTGCFDEKTAVECIKAGAEDYVLKNNLARLAPAIEAAVSARRSFKRLTPRHCEVLTLLAAGRSTSEIARRLKLSVKTVETHRAELMKRLGIHDLAGLVRYAVRVRLTPLEP